MSEYLIEKAIAEQIAFEQTLTANRMNWNLTFQGFMMAAFALAATASKDFDAPDRVMLELVICGAGVLVSLATFLGVKASQKQRDCLKKKWNDDCSESQYPKPFSNPSGSSLGRLPTTLITCGIGAMWLVLMVLVIND